MPHFPADTPKVRTTSVWWYRLTVALLVMGACQYVIRGSLRGVDEGGDLATPYTATQVFWNRGNPYDRKLLRDQLQASQLHGARPSTYLTYSLYPPHTFVLLFPIGLMKWQSARLVMACLNSILPLIAVASFRLTASQTTHRESLVALLLVLFWAPLHTGIALGQLSVMSISFSFIAMQLATSGRQGLAGWLLLASVLAKPHVAFPVVVYFGIRRWWKSLSICLALGLATTVFIGMWWGSDWSKMISSLLENYQFEKVSGSLSPSGPRAWQRIDLAPLWPDQAFQLALLCSLVTWPVIGFVVWRNRNQPSIETPTDSHLRSLTGLCLWSLLVVYHRYYDAYLLLVPLWHALSTSRVPLASGSFKWWLGIGIVPFLVPLAAIIYVKFPTGSGTPSSSIWGDLSMLHVNIVLVIALCICLIAEILNARKSPQQRLPESRSSEKCDPADLESGPADHRPEQSPRF